MGSNDMPELGSRISLISKADIRYEGKLFTVDPQDCTIALANVRSFGTEDRNTDHPVPAQAQIYDYILFRATDIKDISVIPSQQLIYDPAIVQLSVQSTVVEGNRGFQTNLSGSSGHPIVGGSMGGGSFQGPSGFNPMQSGLQSLAPRPQPPKCVLDLLTASRSSTPGLRKVSPSVDQGIQAKLSSPPKDKPRNQQQGGRVVSGNQQGSQRNNQQQQQPRNRDNYQGAEYGRTWTREQPGVHYQNQNVWGSSQQMVGSGGQRWGGVPNRGGGGGRGGGQPPQRGSRALMTRNFPRAPGAGQLKKQPLKFDTDYDFDKANTEFEELRSELAKVKITTRNAPNGEPPANGETEKKDDSGNETGVGEGEHEEIEIFYDKNHSFFDNISCEAIERSKGRSQRMDWRKERKLNSETFGVSMTRRQVSYRGGRGGYFYQRMGYYQPKRGGTAYRGFRPQNKQNNQLPSNLEVAKA